jgi:ribose 5-phosphate isomerase A
MKRNRGVRINSDPIIPSIFPSHSMLITSLMKELVGEYIARRVVDGQVLGIGSGTTVEAALIKIGERIKQEGLKLRGVATSFKSESLARAVGIDVVPLSAGLVPELAFDGADEVDTTHRLIKGKGAAITREKILARRAGGITVLVTAEKLVSSLGEKFPVPVEFLPDAYADLIRELSGFPLTEIKLREGSGKFGPVVTEHGNFLLDLYFSSTVPQSFEQEVKQLPGVVESGVFQGLASEVIVARDRGLFSFELGGELKPLC